MAEQRLKQPVRDVITKMGERFTSGNSIPVERAHITREEWMLVLQAINDLLHASAPRLSDFLGKPIDPRGL